MSFYNGASVLVAGGVGMIGSHIARELLKRGARVTVADDLSSGHLSNIEDIKNKVKLEIADLRRMDACLRLVKGKDYVFQFAADMGGIGYITAVGANIMHNSGLINMNMLQATHELKTKRLFFSSSACIYPEYRQTSEQVKPLAEADAYPAQPDQFYGWEKLFTERMCEAYQRDYGQVIRVGRFHNIYGEAYTAFDPVRGKAPAHLIMKALRYPKEKFVVWGDGKQTRSFLYIDDCVEGVLRLMESDYSHPINIGSDELTTIDGMVAILERISAKKIEFEHDLTKPQGVRGRNADLTLVEKELKWRPKYTLEQGMGRLYNWAAEHLPRIEKAIAEIEARK